MAGWIKTPLGTEVNLGLGHIVLDGIPSPAKGAQQPPLFGRCLLWTWSPISAAAELLLHLYLPFYVFFVFEFFSYFTFSLITVTFEILTATIVCGGSVHHRGKLSSCC